MSETNDPDDIIQAEVVDDSDPNADANKPQALRDLFEDLEARCKAANIGFEAGDDGSYGPSAVIDMPSGRDTVRVFLDEPAVVKELLEFPFERYVFLDPYVAICSYEFSTIEAGIVAPGNVTGSTSAWHTVQALARVPMRERSTRQPGASITLTNPDGVGRLVLGPPSPVLHVLGFGETEPIPRRVSLRIEGIAIKTHDDAMQLLERVSNSLFFQLEVVRNFSLGLTRRRRGRRIDLRQSKEPRPELEFPKHEFDRDPISLYWYARSAREMPLLQFLAFYQTIEFYFPTYSQAEARRKIKNVLKSPAFRADRDTDLARIIILARATGVGFGDERTQLRATINECIDPAALRDWFTSVSSRAEFFSRKVDGLTAQKINLSNVNADLRNDVADRIYDIRCKIVHTKAGGRDGEVELLLPYSKEAELMYNDIDLIQHCAREVLISASTELRL